MSEIDTSHDSELTYKAIGRFIFEFSQLEAGMKYHIAEQCGIKDEHYNVLMVYDFALLCTIAEKVLVRMGDSNGKILKNIISECRRMNDVRVRVAHGLWVPFMQGGTVSHVSRQNLTPRLSSDQTQELERCASQTNALRFQFENYALGQIL
ncbi:MAG TPA: hypothetical protein VMT72_19435 [Pseudolabrys sp.]|nr:hypothetical protein [Pseudolabrys sp.]